jgi:predicted ABC-type ATPase
VADREYVRDEQGRFAEAGGAAGLKAWSGRGAGGFTNEKPQGLPQETWHQHFDRDPNEGGRPSAERAALHQSIIDRATQGVEVPAPGEQKIAVMTMGGPGSGKGTFAQEVDHSHFVVVDPDEVKQSLPEYREGTDRRWTGVAAMAHEESSYVAKQIQKAAIDQGKHLLIDGTGKTLSSFKQKIDQLKAAGYEVHVRMSHVDAATAQPRIDARALKTGRAIPPQVVQKAYREIPKNFQEISKVADHFRVDDNRGAVARTVWEKSPRGEIEHDPTFVREFKAQHWR